VKNCNVRPQPIINELNDIQCQLFSTLAVLLRQLLQTYFCKPKKSLRLPTLCFSGFLDVSFATQEVLDLARTELDSVGSNISITEQAIDAGLILPCGDHVRDLLVEIKKAPLAIHNVYNRNLKLDGDELINHIQTVGYESPLVGDFTYHHPLWSGQGNGNITGQSKDLVCLLQGMGMELKTPQGEETFRACDYTSTII
jgi:hypothetical protein